MIGFEHLDRSIETSKSIESASIKLRLISEKKSTARKQKIARSPKTALRRFLLANVLQRSVNLDRFRAARSIDASKSTESASKKRRSISVEKSTARKQKIVRSRKTAMRRFLLSNVLQRSVIFNAVVVAAQLLANGLAGLAGLAGWVSHDVEFIFIKEVQRDKKTEK